jgi:hypothetical protein
MKSLFRVLPLLCLASLASAVSWPSYKNLGVTGSLRFPTEDLFGFVSTEWPVVPGLGLSYEWPFAKNVSWIFDGLCQTESYDFSRPARDTTYSHEAYVEDGYVYEVFPDRHTWVNFARLRIGPMFTGFKYVYFGIGYHAVWSLEERSGTITYHYLSPTDTIETHKYRPNSAGLSIRQSFHLRLGVTLDKVRVDLTAGEFSPTPGFKLNLTYYPWKRWRWSEE